MTDLTHHPVSCSLVKDSDRLDFLPKFVGPQYMLAFESAVFGFMDSHSAGTYGGGYWDFFTLSNGGFFMAPADEAKFTIDTPNGSFPDLSAKAAGVIACMYVLCALAARTREEQFCDAFYELREFIATCDESDAIYSAID